MALPEMVVLVLVLLLLVLLLLVLLLLVRLLPARPAGWLLVSNNITTVGQ
jgi:hypothetical protein